VNPQILPDSPQTRRGRHRRFMAAILAVLGAMAGLTVAPAHAAFPGRNGRIVYVNTLFNHNSELGDNQIFTIRPDGTSRRQLTYRGESDSPDWAPIGHRIVYRHWPTRGRIGIWIMGANGRHKHPLVPGSRHDFDSDPAWAPNGLRIVFTRMSGRGATDLMVYSLRTRTTRALHVGRGFSLIPQQPAWSPDGRTIAFSVLDKGDPNDIDLQTDLFTVRADGTHLTQVTTTKHVSEESPDWSPSGRRLLFTRLWGACEEEVNTSNPDGTARRRVRSGCTASMPAWSPNGRRILTYAVLGRRSGVWTMSPTGAHRRYVAVGYDGHWQPR